MGKKSPHISIKKLMLSPAARSKISTNHIQPLYWGVRRHKARYFPLPLTDKKHLPIVLGNVQDIGVYNSVHNAFKNRLSYNLADLQMLQICLI